MFVIHLGDRHEERIVVDSELKRGAKRRRRVLPFVIARCWRCGLEVVIGVGRHVSETVPVAGTLSDIRHGAYVFVDGECAACVVARAEQPIVSSRQKELFDEAPSQEEIELALGG